jgi:F1F0 ATPase subunit 2
MIGAALASRIAVGLAAGLALGAFHFASLWWNTRLFTMGAAGKAIVLQLARIAVAVAGLALLARVGFASPLAGAFGFLVARPLLLWRFGALK